MEFFPGSACTYPGSSARTMILCNLFTFFMYIHSTDRGYWPGGIVYDTAIKKIMGDTKDLTNREAIDKIRELAKGNICLFCTYDHNEVVSRPMDTQDVDDDGALWFMSRRSSIKNMQISQNSKVYLMYMDDSKQHYLSLSGKAEIQDDREKIRELWTLSTKAWFTEGKDDPEISLLKVTPEKGHYWDTKNGALISLIKIAAAVITGKEMDGSIQGDINV